MHLLLTAVVVQLAPAHTASGLKRVSGPALALAAAQLSTTGTCCKSLARALACAGRRGPSSPSRGGLTPLGPSAVSVGDVRLLSGLPVVPSASPSPGSARPSISGGGGGGGSARRSVNGSGGQTVRFSLDGEAGGDGGSGGGSVRRSWGGVGSGGVDPAAPGVRRSLTGSLEANTRAASATALALAAGARGSDVRGAALGAGFGSRNDEEDGAWGSGGGTADGPATPDTSTFVVPPAAAATATAPAVASDDGLPASFGYLLSVADELRHMALSCSPQQQQQYAAPAAATAGASDTPTKHSSFLPQLPAGTPSPSPPQPPPPQQQWGTAASGAAADVTAGRASDSKGYGNALHSSISLEGMIMPYELDHAGKCARWMDGWVGWVHERGRCCVAV